MPYTGQLDTQPLLDVIQIVAYSRQSGILTVKGPETRGLLIFDAGNIVCAYSPSALPLLVKAAKERDERHRLTYRRIQVLAALRELFDLVTGDYRFVRRQEPVSELEGLDIKSFYSAGALDTGDLLLALEKAMDEEELVPTPAASDAQRDDNEQLNLRRFTRYGPVVIKGRLKDTLRSYPGYLTNLSVGGTFFHADALPSVGFRFRSRVRASLGTRPMRGLGEGRVDALRRSQYEEGRGACLPEVRPRRERASRKLSRALRGACRRRRIRGLSPAGSALEQNRQKTNNSRVHPSGSRPQATSSGL